MSLILFLYIASIALDSHRMERKKDPIINTSVSMSYSSILMPQSKRCAYNHFIFKKYNKPSAHLSD